MNLKYCFSVLFCFFIMSFKLNAQTVSMVQTNGPNGGKPSSLCLAKDGSILASFNNYIYKSTNNGETWSNIEYFPNSPHPSNSSEYTSLVKSSDGTIYIGLDEGEIKKSEDNGVSWISCKIPDLEGSFSGLRMVRQISFDSTGNIYALLRRAIYLSKDKGLTWTKLVVPPTSANFLKMSISSKSVKLLDTDAGIFRSANNDSVWEKADFGLPEFDHWNGVMEHNNFVELNDGSTIFIVPNGGEVYRTLDGGKSWIKDMWFLKAGWVRTCFKDDSGALWASCNDQIAKSTDNGISWETTRFDIPYEDNLGFLTSFLVTKDKKFLAVSTNRPDILKSADNGRNWQKATTGIIQSDIYSNAIGNNNIIFSSNGRDLYRSADNGNKWGLTGSNITRNNSNIYTDPKGNLYTVDNTCLNISSDGGNSWLRKCINLGDGNPAAAISSDGNGIIVTNNYNESFISTDFGTSWKSLKKWNEQANDNITMVKNGIIYLVHNGVLSMSKDLGKSWEDIFKYPYPELWMTDLVISRKGYIFISFYSNTVGSFWNYLSKDNGKTWKQLPFNIQIRELKEGSNGFLYANEYFQGIYCSKDDGSSWTKLIEGNTSNNYLQDYGYYRSFCISKSGFIFAGTTGKGVFKSSASVYNILPPAILDSKAGDGKATITWNKNNSSNFLKYRIYGSTEHFPVSVVDSISGQVNDTVMTINNLENNKPWYFVVSAVDNQGNESFSDEAAVIPLSAPPAPVLSAPNNNAVNVPAECVFKWVKSDRAEKYILQIGTDSIFSDIVFSDSTIADTLKKVTSLVYDSKYFWRVKAENGSGESNWSEVWTFKIVLAAPNFPYQFSPVNNAIDEPIELQIKWQKLKNADKYHLQISPAQDFSVLLVNDSTLSDTTRQAANLKNNTRYYWRVRAGNIAGYGLWSEVWTFKTIIAIPASPVLLSPANESRNQPLQIKLNWNPIQDAETYKILAAQDTLFTNIIADDSSLVTTSKDITSLKYGMKYYWKLRAKNKAGISSYSPVWDFTTLLPGPVALSAAAYGIKKVKLTWVDKIDNEAGFILERNIEKEAGYMVVDTIEANITSYIDSTVQQATTYKYRLKAYTQFATSDYTPDASVTTLTSVGSWLNGIPTEYALLQNYPNPFNPSTVIRYALPTESKIRIYVYNALGQIVSELVNKIQPAGYFETVFNVGSLPSGIYLYSIEGQSNDGKTNFSSVKKMMIVK